MGEAAAGDAGRAGALAHALRPGAIGSLALPHRIVMGSMHLGVEADGERGGAALAAFYAERAHGGAGLIVTGGAAVSRVGAGGPSYGILDEPAGRAALAPVPEAVHAEGGRIALQLFHAGRYARREAFGLEPVAPSAVASRFTRDTPRALEAAEVEEVVEQFARGAALAVELGFDAVEIMGSEGYLVDQFLSPLTNLRDDAWGGDAERRRRFGVALVRAVRAAVGPAFPVIVRFTGVDLMPGGTPAEEVAAFARALAGAGADALNVGIGWHESPVPTVQGAVPPGVWMPWARAVKAAVGELPVIAGNRVTTVELAGALLAEGGIDFVSMARPFLADPALVARTRAGAPVNRCIACNQACIDRSIVDERVSCMVNPRAGREHALGGAAAVAPPAPAGRGARVAVVGGGPAGMECARALATLGLAVTLFEAEDELGGQFRLARLVPGKEDFGATIEFFAAELARLGVDVRLGTRLGEEDAEGLRGFDAVVLATGVVPRRVELAGGDRAHVVDYVHAFTAGVGGGGRRVAIVGAGGIGVDLAHRLAEGTSGGGDAGAAFLRRWGIEAGEQAVAAPERGAGITLMARRQRVGAGLGRTTRWVSLDALRRAGVAMRTGLRYEGVEERGVRIAALDGERASPELVEADTVVIAAGQEPDRALEPLVRRLDVPHRTIGGARDAAGLDAVRAFAEGLEAAHEIAAALPAR